MLRVTLADAQSDLELSHCSSNYTTLNYPQMLRVTLADAQSDLELSHCSSNYTHNIKLSTDAQSYT